MGFQGVIASLHNLYGFGIFLFGMVSPLSRGDVSIPELF
jgi:hypothetical protein